MDPKYKFTSTGMKLLHHPAFLSRAIFSKTISPLSIQVAPTSNCNLGCSFCSNANRTNGEEIDEQQLLITLADLRRLGAGSVEFTGGGEPTLWPRLNQAMQYCFGCGFKVGLITNGTRLKTLWQENLNTLSWIRISMNVLDERDKIDIPFLPENITLGFSYVMNKDTTESTLLKVRQYAKENFAKYVRIVPDCKASPEAQEENNKVLSAVVKEWGSPFFYQDKHFEVQVNHCGWCYAKPFLLHDNFVYPCSSVVLNSDSDDKFNEKFRWCRIEELAYKYSGPTSPLAVQCDRCVFGPQNKIIDSLMIKTGMEAFV